MSAPAPSGDEEGGDRVDGALRDDIRLLGGLLGESLVRQAGSGLLDLVEHVRAESKAAVADSAARSRLTGVLAALDLPTGTLLGRAFLAYFHLANIAEQVHRADELTQRSTVAVSALERTVNDLLVANLDPTAIAAVVARLDVRPVLTAHPTESSRRSILTLRRRVATLLRQRTDARSSGADRARAQRRLAELIDLLWQTEEVRRERPTPLDEAGATLFYLDKLAQLVIPDLLDDLSVQLQRLGAELPTNARPLRFGTWVGGDRDGNPFVTPEITLTVLALQREHAVRALLESIESLVEQLGISTRAVGVSEELLESLAADRQSHGSAGAVPGAGAGGVRARVARRRRGAAPVADPDPGARPRPAERARPVGRSRHTIGARVGPRGAGRCGVDHAPEAGLIGELLRSRRSGSDVDTSHLPPNLLVFDLPVNPPLIRGLGIDVGVGDVDRAHEGGRVRSTIARLGRCVAEQRRRSRGAAARAVARRGCRHRRSATWSRRSVPVVSGPVPKLHVDHRSRRGPATSRRRSEFTRASRRGAQWEACGERFAPSDPGDRWDVPREDFLTRAVRPM